MSEAPTSKSVEIDGTTYEIQILDAIRGYRIYVKLINAFGGALESTGNVAGAKQEEIALKLLGAAMRSLPAELAEELRSTFAASCSVVMADGKKPQVKDVFAVLFRGRMLHMSKWLLECVKANFADFLGDDSSESPVAALTALFKSKSPAASTGSSTGS